MKVLTICCPIINVSIYLLILRTICDKSKTKSKLNELTGLNHNNFNSKFTYRNVLICTIIVPHCIKIKKTLNLWKFQQLTTNEKKETAKKSTVV